MDKALTIVVDVLNVPELIWDLRREMADVLREASKAESDPRIARRLRVLAGEYEAGCRVVKGDDVDG